MALQTFTTGQVLTALQVSNLQANDYNQTVSTKTANYVLTIADLGSRVFMNAAGATTITVNTGVFAAGDTVWLGNIGAGSCVVTAGTATVSKFSTASLTLSQYQGAYLYFVSTGVAILYSDAAGAAFPVTTKGDLFGYDTAAARIPIGTNNQVLTADSAQALGLKWATPTSAAKSYSLIGTGTLTGNSTTTVTGISGMNTIFILVKGATSATQTSITLKPNNDTTGANYLAYGTYMLSNSTYSAANFYAMNNSGVAGFQVATTSSNAASAVNSFLQLDGCNSSGVKTAMFMGGASAAGGNTQEQYLMGGIYKGTSAITSFSLTSGVANNGGTFEVYGTA
jgi:hypothetical protein